MVLKTIVWTRGEGCRRLAEAIAEGESLQMRGDPADSCVTHRADAVVSRRLTRFDLVPTIVPVKVDLDSVSSVTVAIGDGPHSPLAAALGARLADALGVPGDIRTAFRNANEASAAAERIDTLGALQPSLDKRLAQVGHVDELVQDLTESALLVVGAPGGSWIHRQLFGPGHRLRVTAPGGVIVVRSAPRRCFQEATGSSQGVLSPHLTAGLALELMRHPVAPVAHEGALVGIVRRSALDQADPSTSVEGAMEPPVAVDATESIKVVHELIEFLEFSPVPVLGRKGRLIGTIDPNPAKEG